MPRKRSDATVMSWLRPAHQRAQDLEHWWQLPEDASRQRSAWAQPMSDAVAPATFSVWHRKIAEVRARDYDRLRPTLVRAAALVVLAAGIAVVGASWWVWLMLVPSLVQVAAELVVGRGPNTSGRGPRLNVAATGCLVAGPLNVIAVTSAPAGAEFGWVKIAALAAAIVFLNSALATVLLDPQNYAEASAIPGWLHALRPFVPLLSYLLVTGVVAWGIAWDRWEQPMIPVALLCATLTWLLGGTIRNHDRVIAAAVAPARQAIEEGREDLGRMVHDQLGPIKAAAEGAAQTNNIPVKWASNLASLPALLTHFHTRTGIFDSRRMDLDYLALRILEPYGLWEHLTLELSWGDLSDGDHQTAVTMTTALLHNIGQELTDPEYSGFPKDIVLEGFTTGEGTAKRFHLAARDHLPPVEDWCPPGRSMTELRDMLRSDHDGDLVQETMDDGTKRIVASWADVTAPRGYDDFEAVR